MYVVPMKTTVVEAWRNTFNSIYPEADFANTWVDIEYPVEKQSYPGIWVSYEDTDPIQIAGIDHKEYVTDLEGIHEITRYVFEGTLSFTCAALSSLERDRLFDEMVRVLAFARVENNNISAFRTTIENNDFIGINLNFDVLRPSGDAAGPGTPWGTDEIIYEKTLSIDIRGEFVSAQDSSVLVPLSAVEVQGYRDGEAQPAFPDVSPPPEPNQPWSPTNWH